MATSAKKVASLAEDATIEVEALGNIIHNGRLVRAGETFEPLVGDLEKLVADGLVAKEALKA